MHLDGIQEKIIVMDGASEDMGRWKVFLNPQAITVGRT